MSDEPKIETDFDRCMREVSEGNKDELIQQLLVQIARMRKQREKNTPLWSFVGEATMHGSTYSCAICNVFGVNSHSGAITKQL